MIKFYSNTQQGNPESIGTHASGVYFHGQTEDHFGYDCVQIDSYEDFRDLDPGKHDVEIPGYEGECILYKFSDEKNAPSRFHRAFVVDKADESAVGYAEAQLQKDKEGRLLLL